MKNTWIYMVTLPCLAMMAFSCAEGSGEDVGVGGSGGTQDCPAGLDACAGSCIDVINSPEHCGACLNACDADEVCSGGSCALQCSGGTVQCGNLCVDTQLDPANCGACGTACAPDEVCSGGSCALQCFGGTTQCGNLCVDTQVDPANCGACGTACASGEVCSGGSCSLQCSGGTTQCGNLCVDTQVDPANCGACGNVCAIGNFCANGACTTPGTALDCANLLTTSPTTPSGLYTIDPDGPGGTSAFSAYCDMDTDGGGWTLVLAYQAASGINNDPLVIGVPQDPLTGFSHMSTSSLQSITFSDVRFYCETSAHPRRIHFKTNTNAVSYLRGDIPNAVSHWTSGYTTLANHTAFLPAATIAAYDNQDDTRMTHSPFINYFNYHWNIRGEGRWECDDYQSPGHVHSTLHQVWVR